MTLDKLFMWCAAIVPEADNTVIPSSSTTLLSKLDILNEAAREFVLLARCMPREKKFNVTASNYTYSLTINVPDFLEMREEGIWHLRSDSSVNVWDRLKPITVRELDQRFPSWRTQSVNDFVQNYWQDGDTVGLFYTPSSSLTNGLWIYYYGAASDMSLPTHYPFTGTTSEDPRLAPYGKYLLSYYESKALGIMGYKSDAAAKLTEFATLALKTRAELASRRDLAQESQAKPKTYISRGNPFQR